MIARISSSAPRFFATAEAFRKWLATNATTASELLVGFHKVDSRLPSMTWPASVDEALCFGWIDGVRKRIDESSYTIRFTPRRPTSTWSAINIAKFEKLQAQGRVTAAGAEAFSRRKEDKSVIYAYEQQQTGELSAGELREFKRNRLAWEYFQATPPSYKKFVFHWITTARKSKTRATRFARVLEASAVGQRV